ncbi:hypothetical protein BMR07_18065, partial [Methylococcaceae bacterium CS1]
TTLLILMQKGYPVEAFTEPDKITEIKGTAKLVKMEHTLNVINSDDISDVEYTKLQHANKILESEYFSIEKHECKSQLALDNEPLEEYVLFWDGGRIKPALERFEIVTAQTDDISMLDEYESETMTAAKDKSYATSQKIIFSSVMNLLQDKKHRRAMLPHWLDGYSECNSCSSRVLLAHVESANCPVAYQGLKITTSLSSVSMIFSDRKRIH